MLRLQENKTLLAQLPAEEPQDGGLWELFSSSVSALLAPFREEKARERISRT
jgi:hypothetical protein